ncbi:MAG: hypothetical protein GX235_08810 [Clostridiales bacterium]|nr:hypothetical protein [Clostridiales bacterium]
MDFNNDNYSNQGHNPQRYSYRPPARQPGNGLASAAMFLGITSIVTAIMMTIYFPFIFGSLAILFALLSKGRAAKFMKYARTGIVCGIIGITINLTILISSFVFIMSNPEILTQTARRYDKMYEQVYGISSEDIFGDSLEDIVDDFITNYEN